MDKFYRNFCKGVLKSLDRAATIAFFIIGVAAIIMGFVGIIGTPIAYFIHNWHWSIWILQVPCTIFAFWIVNQ